MAIEILYLTDAFPFNPAKEPEESIQEAMDSSYSGFIRLAEGEYDLTEEDNLVVFKDGRGLYRAMSYGNGFEIDIGDRRAKMVRFPEDTRMTGIAEPMDDGGFGVKTIILYKGGPSPKKL